MRARRAYSSDLSSNILRDVTTEFPAQVIDFGSQGMGTPDKTLFSTLWTRPTESERLATAEQISVPVQVLLVAVVVTRRPTSSITK